jgi:hypothetical protein
VRTVRQLHEQAVEKIYLAIRHPALFADCNVTKMVRLAYWTQCETLHDMWPYFGSKRTTVLLGDVYYTDAAIAKIIKGEYIFYTNAYEVFAIVLRPAQYGRFMGALRKAIAISRHLKRTLPPKVAAVNADCNMWSVYRLFNHQPYHRRFVRDPTTGRNRFPWDSPGLCFTKTKDVCLIQDGTNDFDTPEQYARWLAGKRGVGTAGSMKSNKDDRVRKDV